MEHTDSGHFHPLSVLARRRMQLLACLLLVCGIAFAATMFRKTKYEASARMRLANSTVPNGFRNQGADQWLEFFSTQFEMLKSRSVISYAAECLNHSGYAWDTTEGGLNRLEESIRFTPLSGSGLVDIIGVSEDPEEAAAIANAMVTAFIETSRDEYASSTEQARSRLSGQIARYEEEISNKAEAIQAYREQHQIVGDNTALPAVQQRIRSLEQRLTQAQITRMELAGKRDQIQQMLSRGQLTASSELSLDEINNHPTVVSLQSEITHLKQEELSLAQAYLPSHPELRDTRLHLAELEARLLERKWQLMAASLAEVTEAYAEIVRQEDTLKTMLSQEQAAGIELTVHKAEYEELNESLQTLRAFRDECLSELRNQRLTDEITELPISVVDAARIPTAPAGLSKEHQVASILLLGLVFSVTFVFVLDRFAAEETGSKSLDSHTVYIPVPSQAWGTYSDAFANNHPQQTNTAAPAAAMNNDHQDQLGKITIGGDSQDIKAFSARCRVVHMDQQSAAAGVFRSLSTRLLNRFGAGRQSLVVTGPTASSGKTTCACNLALMLAKTGKRVLLVEANQSTPALSAVFGSVDSSAALTDIINDVTLIEDSISSTDIENLDVLSAGMNKDHLGLVSAHDIGTLNNELLELYDWVIYDTGSTEASFTQTVLKGVGKSLVVSMAQNAQGVAADLSAVEHYGAISVSSIANSFSFASSTPSTAQAHASPGAHTVTS